MCPAGAAMLPTSITGAATREPSAAWVHTNVPTRTSVTRTDPLGVAIIVESARQIGQLGAPVALREPTVTRERKIGPARRQGDRSQELPCAVHHELLGVGQVARGQVLVGDDRGVHLGVSLDLRKGRDCSGLLGAGARDGVEVRIAVDRRADGVHHRELQPRLAERAADDRSRPDGPAGGDGKQHQRGGKPHLNEMTAAEQFGNEPDRGTKRNPEPY